MRYKIVVKHLGNHTSRYDFPWNSSWSDDYEMYKRDVMQGFYLSVELWKRTNVVATGEPGEQVWQLVERFPQED